MEATSGRKPTLAVLVLIGVVVVAAAVVAVVAIRDDGTDDGGEVVAGGAGSDVLSGPGTDLAYGLEVAPGSSLIGPVVVTEVDTSGGIASWSALVLVEEQPLDVWQAYADQLDEQFPDTGIDVGPAPGCDPALGLVDRYDVDWADPLCSLDAHDGDRSARMSLRSVPGDVTGQYLLRLTGDAYEPPFDGGSAREIPTGVDELPPPLPAREPPEVGGPLAPATVAYEGDNEEYVLVEGTELLAQYGVGSITGGFDVMLRVRPDADLGSVVDSYVEQADQFKDAADPEETPSPREVEHDGTTVSTYRPPGGAGGYTGTIVVVDRPAGDDYILFELAND